jgi:hypothetical protein
MNQKVYDAFNEVKTKAPNLVKRLLDKSSNEPQGEQETIYGYLCDWVVDEFSSVLDMNERDELVKRLLADYVIHHPYCLQKTFIVIQESNVDGEIYIDTTPCASIEAARKVLQAKRNDILRESYHFGGIDLEDDDYEVEESEDSFYINDNSDDYYEDIKIVEKNIVIM